MVEPKSMKTNGEIYLYNFDGLDSIFFSIIIDFIKECIMYGRYNLGWPSGPDIPMTEEIKLFEKKKKKK